MLITNITKRGNDISIRIDGCEVLYRDVASYAIYDTNKRKTSLQYLQNNGGYVCITYKNGSTEWLTCDRNAAYDAGRASVDVIANIISLCVKAIVLLYKKLGFVKFSALVVVVVIALLVIF